MKPALIVVSILTLLNLYLAISFRWKLGSGAGTTIFVVFAMLAFLALQLVGPLFDWSLVPTNYAFGDTNNESLLRASYLAIGVMSCLFVFSVVADAAALFMIRMIGVKAADLVRFISLAAVLLITVGTVFVGWGNAGKVKVERVDLPLATLGPAFDGLTIAQISDLHVGLFLKRPFVQAIVDELANLNPDIVVLTGDVADRTPDKLLNELVPFTTLHPPLGLYYVTGNHEYYVGAPLWVATMRQLGFRTMNNENVAFEKEGSVLTLAGVPDVTAFRIETPPYPDLLKALEGSPAGATAILLSHQPKTVKLARQAGFAAQLSGHTHAGQYFPFTWIIRLFDPYPHGLYDIDGFKLYVNKGTGFWGPPLRTGGPGEITLLTLRTQAPTER